MSKPRRTGCLTILGVLTLAAALFITREIYLAVTATPGSAVDYQRELVELAERAQPEGRDGWADLMRAVRATERVHAEFDPDLLGDAFYLTRSPALYDQEMEFSLQDYLDAARAILARLEEEGVWESLDRVAASPRAVNDTTVQGADRIMYIVLPELGRTRQIARALAARMRLAHQAGLDDEAARAFEHGMAISRVASSQPLVISRMVGIAIAHLMVDDLQHELVERPHDEAALRRMLAALERQRMPGLSLALEGERVMALDTIQWTHTDDGAGNGRLILTQLDAIGVPVWGGDALKEWKIINTGSIAFPSKRKTAALADLYFDALIDRAKLTYAERNATPAAPVLGPNGIPSRQLVLQAMLSSYSRALDHSDFGRTAVGGAKLALAIELYRIEHGARPASLDDLVPGVLSELPTDPLAADGRFRLKALSGDPDGRDCLLYSTGRDGEDNGGAFQPDVDIMSPHEDPGFDIPLNLPREKPEPTDAADRPNDADGAG